MKIIKSLSKVRSRVLNVFAALLFISFSVPAVASKVDLTFARDWPVLSGGRLKPFQVLARDLVLNVTGKSSTQGLEPTEVVFSWMVDTDKWDKVAFIQINREDVRKQLNLDVNQPRFSPSELIRNSALLQYADELSKGSTGLVQANDPGKQGKQDPRRVELKRVFERLVSYRQVVTGDAIPLFPRSGFEPWATLGSARQDEASGVKLSETDAKVYGLFQKAAILFHEAKSDEFLAVSQEMKTAIESQIGDFESQRKTLQAESLYIRMDAFFWAWILYLTAAILLSISIALKDTGVKGPTMALSRIAKTLGTFAVLSHLIGFALRAYVTGRPPVTNMYESVIWVGFGVVLFGTILYYTQKRDLLLPISWAVASLCLIVADSAPAMLDPTIQPLVPVLRSNMWLTIHVLTITLGYAAFALTLGIGNVALFQFLKTTKDRTESIMSLNQLTYRAMQFGVVLLAAGTILGGVWADYSWGRFWGWDPKEVWALVALLTYVILLHARYVGWVGTFAFPVWAIAGFLSVLMAWYGVNFVLGVGLHSYGFSAGGASFVTGFVTLQLAWVAFVFLKVRSRKNDHKGLRSEPAAG